MVVGAVDADVVVARVGAGAAWRCRRPDTTRSATFCGWSSCCPHPRRRFRIPVSICSGEVSGTGAAPYMALKSSIYGTNLLSPALSYMHCVSYNTPASSFNM